MPTRRAFGCRGKQQLVSRSSEHRFVSFYTSVYTDKINTHRRKTNAFAQCIKPDIVFEYSIYTISCVYTFLFFFRNGVFKFRVVLPTTYSLSIGIILYIDYPYYSVHAVDRFRDTNVGRREYT